MPHSLSFFKSFYCLLQFLALLERSDIMGRGRKRKEQKMKNRRSQVKKKARSAATAEKVRKSRK